MAQKFDGNESSVCMLMELFRGRFEQQEMEYILGLNGNDRRAATDFIFHIEPAEMRRMLDKNVNNWETVERKIKNVRLAHWSEIKRGRFATQVRQFACPTCDSYWWRRVPSRKIVSSCKTCKKRYDAVPENREWGIGVFYCHVCLKEFRGWGQMELIPSPCFGCRTPIYPTRILPPMRQQGEKKSRANHQCLAHDCYNPFRDVIYQATCVHPRSRQMNGLPHVVHPSLHHYSTGSTVATFLDQDDLDCDLVCEVFRPPL